MLAWCIPDCWFRTNFHCFTAHSHAYAMHSTRMIYIDEFHPLFQKSCGNPITKNHYSSPPSRPWSAPHPDSYNKFRRLLHASLSSPGWFKMNPSTAMWAFMSIQFKHSWAFQRQEDCKCCESHSLVGTPKRILQRRRECKFNRGIFLHSESSWALETNAHEGCPWSWNKTLRMGDVALSSTPWCIWPV
jgi:hypothetical protein